MFFRALRLLALILFCASVVEAKLAFQWNLNDLTYLFPLSGDLMSADRQLFPSNVYSQLMPPIIDGSVMPEQTYSRLRVVGARIDPCAPFENQSGCDPQVRLVWQPVVRDSSGKWTTQDGAMHTFYRLTESEMNDLLKRLQFVKRRVRPRIDLTKKPLQIHPAFLDPIVGPFFSVEIKSILRRVCREKNLIQVTAVQLSTPNIWWQFYGIRRSAHQWIPIKIPRIERENQNYFNYSQTDGMETNLYPVNESLENISSTLREVRNPTEKNREQFRATLRVVRKFQNPKWINTHQLDCMQCHLAGPTATWMNRSLKELEVKTVTDEFTYVNPDPSLYDLSNVTQGDQGTKNLRSLGYIGTQPSINQRTIHETAEVADRLNRMGGGMK